MGFGRKNYNASTRFIRSDGGVNIKRTGLNKLDNLDIYHWLITTSLTRLFFVIICSYTIANLIFAFVYYSLGVENFGGLNTDSELDSFLSLFFFSAQTLTTVGYGHVYPLSHYVSLVSATESLLGLLGFALATGVLYGRFSRPKADLLYSKNILIAPYEGAYGLMFRIANKKQYELIESEASVTISYTDPVTKKREFDQLKLEINRINYLALSWTIVHPLNDESPLKGWTQKDFQETDIEIMILMKAINDTFSQTVYSRHSYKSEDIIEHAKFVPLRQEIKEDGRIVVSVNEIHQFTKTDPQA